MPNRVVSYIFRGNFTNLSAGLASSSRNVGQLGSQLAVVENKAKTSNLPLKALGFTAAGVAIGIAAAVSKAAEFDQEMSNIKATGSEAAASLNELRGAAISAGAATKYSATEAAGGIENLLKAGVSASDVLGGGLAGALDLAAAGELEVADAAEIAATALTQFKLQGEDIPHVADLLAAGAGKAQGSVSDLSMALKQSGLVASQMGLSVEETTGTLAAFASAGLLGSDAGTSFRTMLLRLANPTEESAALMKSLGIEAYDASGQFVGMSSVAGQLQTAFEGKTQAERDSALATIFGSDAIRAAAVLYEQGAGGVDTWTAKVDDAGFAAKTAATRMDNLRGDLEKLRGAFETALVGAGESGQSPARSITQQATSFLDSFAIDDRSRAAATAQTKSLADLEGALQSSNVGAYADKLGIDIGKLAKDLVVYGEKGTYASEVTKQLTEDGTGFLSSIKQDAGNLTQFSNNSSRSGDALKDLGVILANNTDLLGQGEGAVTDTAAAQKALGLASAQSSAALDAQNQIIEANIQAMKDSRQAALGAFDAETQWRVAVKAATAAGKQNTAGIRGSSKAAVDNRNRLSDLASAWNNQSDAVKNNKKRYADAKQAFLDAADGMGVSKKAAKELVDQLLEIPTKTKSRVDVDISQANSAIGSVNAALSRIGRTIVTATVRSSGIAQARAAGGYIAGPGTGTSDSIPAWLSDGEYVVNARATARHRGLLEHLNARGFADGGYAGSTRSFTYDGFAAGNAARALDKVAKSGDKASRSLDRESAKRDVLTAMRDATRSAVTDGFRSDVFAVDTSNPWSATASANPNGTLRNDISNARRFNAAIGRLKAKGLGGSALAEILDRGDLGLAEQYATQSKASLSQYERLYNTRDRVTAGVGAAAGNAVAQLSELKRLNQKIDRLERAVKAGARATGDAVGNKINSAASTGTRNRNRNP